MLPPNVSVFQSGEHDPRGVSLAATNLELLGVGHRPKVIEPCPLGRSVFPLFLAFEPSNAARNEIGSQSSHQLPSSTFTSVRKIVKRQRDG